MNSERIRTCFISAPGETNIGPIRQALTARGVNVLGLSDVAAGTSWQAALISSIIQADLIIGVLAHRDSANMMFELGIAAGYKKPVLIFAPAKGDILPSNLKGFQVVRTSLHNREAIDFALDQILASPATQVRAELPKTPLNQKRTIAAGYFRERLAQVLRDGHWRELETLVAQVLRESGAEVVAESDTPDKRIDLVVWSDGLRPYVDNPFPIEIKARLRTREDAKRALNQTERSANVIGSRWSMLLYGEGPTSSDRVWLSNPAVLALKIDDLLIRLEPVSFPDIARTLRNRHVHGLDG